MPQLIQHIDQIGREKQRAVLYLTFNPPATDEDDFWGTDVDWENDAMRRQVIAWLVEHQINYQPCDAVASENCMVSYQGQIYVDVPYDETDKQYQLVRGYLENPDGTMIFATVTFWVLPLENAMINAHHDEPGFWEKWAENF